MEEALGFFKANEIWIYGGLGLFGLLFALRFYKAWDELRRAAFGLERESAQVKLNQAASVLMLLFIAAIIEFALVSFVIPAVPGADPLRTPTLNLLTTPTQTLAPGQTPEPTSVGQAPISLTDLQSGCLPDAVMLTSPQSGDSVQGIVPVEGTANIENFGFYKFEMTRPNDLNWLSIQAGDVVTEDGFLGSWDTTRLDPGIYLLRLVVTDNEGRPWPACGVEVNVLRVE